ncbi:MAG: histidine phosphatase family protein [Pseudomonadota bacterium]
MPPRLTSIGLSRSVSNLLKNNTDIQNFGSLMLVRHGLTDWNKKTLWTGRKNIPISEEGKEQARILAEKLKGNFFPHIAYTTPLIRARTTCDIILKIMDCDIPIYEDERMLEQDVGSLTGTFKTEESKIIVKGPFTRPGPRDPNCENLIGAPNEHGAESRYDVEIRTNDFYEKLLKPELIDGKNIVVCAHSNSIKGLIKNITFLTGITIGNTEAIKLLFKSDEKGEFVFSEMIFMSRPGTEIQSLNFQSLIQDRHLGK